MKVDADTGGNVCVLPKYRGTEEEINLMQEIERINKKFRKQLIEEIEELGFIRKDKQTHTFESNNCDDVRIMKDKADKLIDDWKAKFRDIQEKIEICNYKTVIRT